MKKGYKKTELGWIPEEWEVRKLEEFSVSSSYGPRFSAELYDENGNCKIIRGTDVIANGKVEYEGIPYASISNEVLEKHRLEENDFVVITTADCGVSFVFNASGVFMPSAYMVRIRFNDKINPYFVNKIFDNKIIKRQVEKCIRKGTIANLPGADLLKFKVCIPSLKEQKEIADILSTLDSQIDDTDKLIEKIKKLKKGLMQRLLTKGIEHTEFNKTELGEIPVEWKVKSLIDISIKIGDGLHGTPRYDVDGEYYFINGNNLMNGSIIISEETKKISKLEYLKNKKELNSSTLLISLNGTIGNIAYYNNEKIMLGKSSGYIVLNGHIDKNYVYHVLNSSKTRTYFIKELTGTTIKNLSLNALRKTPIALPVLEEQKKIASVLSSVDTQIEEYKNEKSKLEELKKGLMQKLLTGKIRVKL